MYIVNGFKLFAYVFKEGVILDSSDKPHLKLVLTCILFSSAILYTVLQYPTLVFCVLFSNALSYFHQE